MKRLITLICLSVCFVVLLTSCAGKKNFDKVYKDYEWVDEYAETLTSLDKISGLKDYELVSAGGSLVAFANEDDQAKVYNVATGEVIYSFNSSDVDDFGYFEIFGKDFFYIVREANGEDYDYRTAFYNVRGEEFANVEGEYDADDVRECEDLFQIDDKVYRVYEDGSVNTVIADNPFFGTLPEFDAKTADYYYYFGNDYVAAYDYNLEQVAYWQAASDEYDVRSMNLLSEDRVLVQMVRELPDSEKKYDYIYEGTKYELKSYLINVKKNDAKEIALDYIVKTVSASTVARPYGSDPYLVSSLGIDNYAVVYMIEDKVVKTAESEIVYADLNGKTAKIKSILFADIDGTATPIAEDRFLYENYSGETYLMDANGEILSRFSRSAVDSTNENFIKVGDKLYNFDLQLVRDLEYSDKAIYGLLAHTALLKANETNDDGYYYYYVLSENGEDVKLKGKYVSNGKDYIITRDADESDVYYVYDEYGTQIKKLSETSGVRVVASYEGTYVLAVANADYEVEYYTLK